jgi:hypothetical protein
MKKTILFILVIGFYLPFANAQYLYPRNTTSIDVSFAKGKGTTNALSINQLFGLGAKKRFKIGLGLRLSNFSGKDLEYTTAPAKLASEPASVDTFLLTKAQSNSLNLSIHLQHSHGKFDLGFNIDALGATFGKAQTGLVLASPSNLNNTNQNATLTKENLLLVGNNDKGSLNSELYLRYWLKPRIGIRAGASFLFSEYTTNQKIAFDNDRFRYKTLQPMLAISVKL